MNALKRFAIFIGILAITLLAISLAGQSKAQAAGVTCFKGDRVAECPATTRDKTTQVHKPKQGKRYVAPPSRAGKTQIDANGNNYCPHGRNSGSTSIEPLVQPLKSKVQEIVAACGSKVISTGCRGGVTPNHREWKAADVTGNPQCIYSHLQGWAGGYSTDYGSVRPHHVHISYSHEHEWGKRFAHGGGHHFARHRHLHYAKRSQTQ